MGMNSERMEPKPEARSEIERGKARCETSNNKMSVCRVSGCLEGVGSACDRVCGLGAD